MGTSQPGSDPPTNLILIDVRDLKKAHEKHNIDFKVFKDFLHQKWPNATIQCYADPTCAELIEKLLDHDFHVIQHSIIESAVCKHTKKLKTSLEKVYLIDRKKSAHAAGIKNVTTREDFSLEIYEAEEIWLEIIQQKENVNHKKLETTKESPNKTTETQNIATRNKVAIFMDGPNADKMFEAMNIKIDYKIFLDWLLNGRKLIQAFYYLRRPLFEHQFGITKKLADAGFTVRMSDSKEDTDPTMVADIARISKTNAADVYIIVSGDHEYFDTIVTPAIKNDWGVEIVSIESKLSAVYKQKTGFTIIDPEQFAQIIKARQTLIDTKDKHKKIDEKIIDITTKQTDENASETEIQTVDQETDTSNSQQKVDAMTKTNKSNQPSDTLRLLNIIGKMIDSGELTQIKAFIKKGNRQIKVEIVSTKIPTKTVRIKNKPIPNKLP